MSDAGDDGAGVQLRVPEMSGEDTRRRLRKRNLPAYYGLAGAVWVMGAITAPDWFGVFITTPSLVLGMVVLVQFWSEKLSRTLLAWAGGVGIVTLLTTSYMQNNVSGSMCFALVAGVWITGRSERRKRLVLYVTVAVAVVSCLAFLSNDDTAVRTVLMHTVFAATWVWSIVDIEEQNRLVQALERAKDAEQEASLLRQRNRIAADLHDIQGHTLHVIKLKAAVAARMLSADPDRTGEELDAIQRLVAESIEQGRQLVNASHRLSLSAEMMNAAHLFEAAGIDVRVREDEAVDDEWEAVAALVLREATTNILRHAVASRVEVTVGDRELEVRNDGVHADPDGYRGLATLRGRVLAEGGRFSAERQGEWFVVRARGERG